jgi:hypothetical protein
VNTIVYIVVSKLTPGRARQIETQFFDEVDEYLKAEGVDGQNWRLIYNPEGDTPTSSRTARQSPRDGSPASTSSRTPRFPTRSSSSAARNAAS